MKRYVIALLTLISSGCTSYPNRTDLAECLSVGDYNNRITNQKIIDSLNSEKSDKIKIVIVKGRVRFNKNNDEITECPVAAYYEDGHITNGVLSSFGRWSNDHNIKYKYLTNAEYHKEVRQEKAIKENEINKINTENYKRSKLTLNEFHSAEIYKYPFLAKIYCYNTKTLKLYTPATCGVAANGNNGPTNLYAKNSPSLDVMLEPSFLLKVSMWEPNPFMGIRVEIVSRKSNKVVDSQNGDFTHTVVIKK